MTLRDLLVMAEARRYHEWEQTGWIAFWIAQCQTKTKLKPENFNPLPKKKKAKAKDPHAWKYEKRSWL